uniref:uncharacterized protein LOC105350349 n=1 Tax=Fragaria vesca subsp. vesca TaxID=101020 RepID=UPI0005C9C1D0|nr:PREDICTED: uncharacterized protein LOC105350349 [Fragaria vesca subsp. vesca]
MRETPVLHPYKTTPRKSQCPLNPRAPSSKMGRRKKTQSISTSPEVKSCLDSNSNSNSISNSNSDSGEAKSKTSIEQLESQIHELQISQSHLHNLIALETLPVFHGRAGNDNAVDWLTATERHFAYLGIPAADRVKIAATRLRGDASPWMCWYESRYPATAPWSSFRYEFLRFFRPESLIAAVCNLEQKRSVKEYEVEFLRVAAGAGDPSPEWSDEELMRHFVGGLKEEIRRKVESFRPKTLGDAMDFARNVEAGNA